MKNNVSEQVDNSIDPLDDRSRQYATLPHKPSASSYVTPPVITTPVKVGILKEALEVVSARSDTHGESTKNMLHIAAMWSAYLGIPLTAVDVTNMMGMGKMSRIKMGDPKRLDHYVDIAGYAAIGGEAAQK